MSAVQLPTTEAMAQAALDAYDVAAADALVARRKWHDDPTDDRARAAYVVAEAAADYAWAVLVSARADARRSA